MTPLTIQGLLARLFLEDHEDGSDSNDGFLGRTASSLMDTQRTLSGSGVRDFHRTESMGNDGPCSLSMLGGSAAAPAVKRR